MPQFPASEGHVQQAQSREPGDGDVDIIHRHVEDARDPSHVRPEGREPSQLENRQMVPLRERRGRITRELPKLPRRPRFGRGSLELHELGDHGRRERKPSADSLHGSRGKSTATPQELRESRVIEPEVSGEGTE